jgi:hypothetical protein
LRGFGTAGTQLASRLSRLSKFRNSEAHPDVGLVGDILNLPTCNAEDARQDSHGMPAKEIIHDPEGCTPDAAKANFHEPENSPLAAEETSSSRTSEDVVKQMDAAIEAKHKGTDEKVDKDLDKGNDFGKEEFGEKNDFGGTSCGEKEVQSEVPHDDEHHHELQHEPSFGGQPDEFDDPAFGAALGPEGQAIARQMAKAYRAERLVILARQKEREDG